MGVRYVRWNGGSSAIPSMSHRPQNGAAGQLTAPAFTLGHRNHRIPTHDLVRASLGVAGAAAHKECGGRGIACIYRLSDAEAQEESRWRTLKHGGNQF